MDKLSYIVCVLLGRCFCEAYIVGPQKHYQRGFDAGKHSAWIEFQERYPDSVREILKDRAQELEQTESK